MKKSLLLLFALCLLGGMTAQAQDYGRENGFGIRLSGEMSSKIDDNDHIMNDGVFGDTLYVFFPTTGLKAIHLDAFYKAFLGHSKAFIETQLGGYYRGQKESKQLLFLLPDSEIRYAVLNDDMNEWGAAASIMGGYNFAINHSSSLDVFTGPELQCTFYCKRYGLDLLKWHFNRWLTRWKLGVGYNYKHVGAQISGSYDLTEKSQQMKGHEFTFSLGLGYKF